MKTISFVIPCYNSEKTIRSVVEEIENTIKTLDVDDYEIILVNDSSPDNVFSVICSICEANSKIRGIDLAKNFGQHAAILAGVKNARNDILVFIDDDGQIPVEEVGKLLDALEDCDIVFAKYENKRHKVWRNIGSRINDRMVESLLGKPKSLSITSYIAIKRFVADEIRKYNGSYPYLYGLLFRSSGKIKNVSVSHRERKSGRSGYTFKKLVSLWLNGFTAFSVKPLRTATIIGFLTAIGGAGYGVYVLMNWLIRSSAPLGWSSMMAALMFIGGMIMIILGLIGEYVGRSYLNISNAPQYVVRERIGFEEE